MFSTGQNYNNIDTSLLLSSQLHGSRRLVLFILGSDYLLIRLPCSNKVVSPIGDELQVRLYRLPFTIIDH